MSVERPKVADKNDPRYFSIKTGQVQALLVKADDGTESRIIRGTASSSIKDRSGDVITEVAQAGMLTQAKGMTMWLNHSYKVPEDILGTCSDVSLQRTGADDGSPVLDLLIDIAVDGENPRAVQSWQHIQNGTKLGLSIGGYFRDVTIEDDDEYGYSLTVNQVELLEISLVGIPANPRAYTRAFESVTESLKGEVVRRAEALIADGAERGEAGILVCKSLFGDTIEDLELLDADAVNTAAAHNPEDAEPLLGKQDVETKDVGMADAGNVITAMKCIAQMAAHGLCTEALPQAKVAHAAIKALLPEEYDVPPDAEIPEQAAASEIAFTASVDAASLIAAQAVIDAAKLAQDELDKATSELAQLSAQRDELERQIANQKATPVGAITRDPIGSTMAAKPVDLSTLDAEQLRQHTQRMLSGQREPLDARALSA